MITIGCHENVRAIHLPPGATNSGGSCDYMTKACKEYCVCQINQYELDVYNTLINVDAKEIAIRIRTEMIDTDCNILSWFATGDCPETLTGKISNIIYMLSKEGCIQCGFTRNSVLWERLLPLANTKIALTVEDPVEALSMSRLGMVGMPYYKQGVVEIMSRKRRRLTFCGENFVVIKGEKEEVYPEDCGNCHKERIGCFE